jgi:adenylate cyclase
VDEFHGDNQGLVVAEVELEHENEHFEKPDWLGKEVTGIDRYYNCMLTREPFKFWNNKP